KGKPGVAEAPRALSRNTCRFAALAFSMPSSPSTTRAVDQASAAVADRARTVARRGPGTGSFVRGSRIGLVSVAPERDVDSDESLRRTVPCVLQSASPLIRTGQPREFPGGAP